MDEDKNAVKVRTWTIDLSGLTGADVGKLLQADSGDMDAAQELLEKTLRPNMEALPLTEWNEARGELVRLTIATIFPRKNAG